MFIDTTWFIENPSSFRILKNGKHRSLVRDKNQLSTGIQPINYLTSLMKHGGFMLIIVLTLSGFVSILYGCIIKPRNFSKLMPNAHLVIFNYIQFFYNSNCFPKVGFFKVYVDIASLH